MTRAQTKTFRKIDFQFVYCSFFLNHLELKRQIRLYTPVVSSKIYNRLQTVTAQNPHPLGRHIPYMAFIMEYPSVVYCVVLGEK